MKINSTANINTKKIPSFGANVTLTSSAKKILERDFVENVFNGKPYNFEGLLAAYKKSLEDSTQGIDGRIKIFAQKRSKTKLAIAFIDTNDKILKRNFSGYKLNPEDFPKNEHSIKEAVIQAISHLGDIVAHKGVGYEKNQFAQIVRKLIFTKHKAS